MDQYVINKFRSGFSLSTTYEAFKVADLVTFFVIIPKDLYRGAKKRTITKSTKKLLLKMWAFELDLNQILTTNLLSTILNNKFVVKLPITKILQLYDFELDKP